ncbi:hypothetical protein J7M23_05585 [Candidatus Sumerlaeota bacterium]|nr:hypothetical protein [Candidatus Sumerlaeota bacterium]
MRYRRPIDIVVLFIAFWILVLCLYSLRNYRLPGGDTDLMLTKWRGFLSDTRLAFHQREPGEFLAHQLIFHLLKNTRLELPDIYSISGALAGAVYVLLIIHFIPHPLFWIVNLVTGSMYLFIGHIECYAWVNVILVFYYFLVHRKLSNPESKIRLFHLWTVLLVAGFFHRLAVIYFPTILFFLVRRTNGKIALAKPPRKEISAMLIVLIIFCMVNILPMVLYLSGGKVIVFEIDNNLAEMITPFTWSQAQAVAERSQLGAFFEFLFGSREHLRHLFLFHTFCAPIGLLTLIVFGWRIRTPFQRFMLGASILGLLWSVFWYPHGGFFDWDLFSNFSFPLNILAGSLLADLTPGLYLRL